MTTARWGPFTMKERATICVALAMFAAMEAAENHIPAVTDAAELISEINVAMGNAPVDDELLTRLRML